MPSVCLVIITLGNMYHTHRSKDEETKDKDKDKTELIKKSISKMAASQSKPLETEPEDKSVAKVTVPGEKDLHVKAKLTGVEVTLCDHHGDLLTANVKGVFCLNHTLPSMLASCMGSSRQSQVKRGGGGLCFILVYPS